MIATVSLRRRLNILAGAAALFLSFSVYAGDIMDNDALALIMAQEAKGLVQHSSRSSGVEDQHDRLRQARGSKARDQIREAECGGIAIGNVHTTPGDHRQNNTTVIIRGDVVNANNRC